MNESPVAPIANASFADAASVSDLRLTYPSRPWSFLTLGPSPRQPPSTLCATCCLVPASPPQARDFEIKKVPIPQIGPEEILLKVDICGVCGTDVSLLPDSST
jgi:hypothetical protein